MRDDPDEPPNPSGKRFVHHLQDRLLVILGRAPDSRGPLVHAMLAARRGDTAGYWLQLAIATMLATLGLALGSTAVVIGAMLVAPLMQPLVQLAMGLATGSAALVVRALVRTAISIVVVVGVAIAITWLLPFHEITGEIEARTAPSLLDLVVAGSCAFAAAYATLRSDADMATTAAGTSIGISLVPPLCAAGYGIGTGDAAISRGAALLFTANISGILAVATVVFVLAGFARVDIREQEEGALSEGSRASAAARVGQALSRGASRRLGPFARFLPPLVLVAIVFVPLQRALREITHRNAVRQAIADLLAPDQHRVVQYTLEQPSDNVVLRVVVVGDARTSTSVEKSVRERLAALDVPHPKLSVWAVPDAASVVALSRRVDEIPLPTPSEPAAVVAERYSTDTGKAIREMWPSSAGELLAITRDVEHQEHLHLEHLGPALGPVALDLMGKALQPTAGPLQLDETALAPAEAEVAHGAAWLAEALALIARARTYRLHVCIVAPPIAVGSGKDAKAPAGSEVVQLVRGTVALAVADGTAVVTDGDHFRSEATRGLCPP